MLESDWSGGKLKAETTRMREGCSYASVYILFFMQMRWLFLLCEYWHIPLSDWHSVRTLFLYFMYFVFTFHQFNVFHSLEISILPWCARVLPTLPVRVEVVEMSIKEQRIESSWSSFVVLSLHVILVSPGEVWKALKASRHTQINWIRVPTNRT